MIPNIIQFVLLLVVGTLVAIPAIQNVFDEVGTQDTLPAVLYGFKSVVNNLIEFWYIPLVAIIAVLFYINTPKGKYKFDYFKYKMPIFGELIFTLDFQD